MRRIVSTLGGETGPSSLHRERADRKKSDWEPSVPAQTLYYSRSSWGPRPDLAVPTDGEGSRWVGGLLTLNLHVAGMGGFDCLSSHVLSHGVLARWREKVGRGTGGFKEGRETACFSVYL